MKKPEPVEANLESFEDTETTEVAIPEGPTFASLGLGVRMLETLAGLGFVTPTPIQVNAIPPLLEGRDLVGQARTGTGKTAAFGLPLITRLARGKGRGLPRAIVMTPTRELALQVTEALRQFSDGSGLDFLTVYGGSAYGPQLRGLREGVDVVIGTPGRVIDLMERGDLKLGQVEVVVLDEADEMLEMGFIEAVEQILAGTPADTRQVALFSATMPPGIRKVADGYLKDPVSIKETSQTVIAIEQRYVQVPPRFKREALLRILRSEDRGATLVFASTRISCAEAADFLAVSGIPAEPLHGDLSQPARERVIELLRAKRVEVVVATDIAARGIDIEHLTHIINLDLPKNVEVYTHRIGRTGRAGRKGKAITLVVPRESLRFTEALRRRGVVLNELFIASEHELAMRQRNTVAQDLIGLATDPKLEDAQRWANELIAQGLTAEEVAGRALALLGDAKNLRLGQILDKGLPPWARQPTPPPRSMSGRPLAIGGAPVHEAAEPKAAPKKKRAEPIDTNELEGEPQGEGFVIIGIGHNHAVRPADLVGALTNELGLTGRDIGRVEIRDNASVIGVPMAFAARVGEDAWPVTIRRIDTTVRRYEQTADQPARKPYVKRADRTDGPPVKKWSPLDRPQQQDDRPQRPQYDDRPPRAGYADRAPRAPAPRPQYDDRPARDERPPRPQYEERPVREERPARPQYEERPARDAAPVREERPVRDTAPVREERPVRDAAPREDRPARARPEAPPAERPHRARAEAPPAERPHRARAEAPPERAAPEPRLPYGKKTDAPRAARPSPVRTPPDADRKPARAQADADRKPARAPADADRKPSRATAHGDDDRRATRAPAAPAADTRRPTKRPIGKPTLADRAPRRAVDVTPRTPRTPR